MGARQRRIERKVRVDVDYGMGGSVSGVFSRDELAGKPAGEVIQRVLDHPQALGTAARTAKVLRDAIQTGRAIDLELTRNESRRSEGAPITFERILVPREEEAGQGEKGLVQETEEITMRLSESYCGGDSRWQPGRTRDRG